MAVVIAPSNLMDGGTSLHNLWWMETVGGIEGKTMDNMAVDRMVDMLAGFVAIGFDLAMLSMEPV